MIIDLPRFIATERPSWTELEDDGIDPGEVVRQQEKTARRQPLHAMRRDAVHEVPEDGADGAEETFEKGGSGRWHGGKNDG